MRWGRVRGMAGLFTTVDRPGFWNWAGVGD